MTEDFGVKITKPGTLYLVEKWQVGEDRIIYLEKKRSLTLRGSKRKAKHFLDDYLFNKYVKEKI
jgi:hypothetical protein